MIVVDASAVVGALLNRGSARRILRGESLHAPHLIDVEVASTLRRLVASGSLPADEGHRRLGVLRELGVTRYPAGPLLDRVWELRTTVTAHDAMYVALAEAMNCALITADARLGRAPGVRCPVTVVPG